ncbi:hypothetical protein P4S64_04170 [Vibrio sp. M60_M31a]
MINGLVFSKAEIQLDPDISQIEDVLIITTKKKLVVSSIAERSNENEPVAIQQNIAN